jgi:hypothetical protein
VERLQKELQGAASCWDPLGTAVQGQLMALLADRSRLMAANACLTAQAAALAELLAYLRPPESMVEDEQQALPGRTHGAVSPHLQYSYLVSPLAKGSGVDGWEAAASSGPATASHESGGSTPRSPGGQADGEGVHQAAPTHMHRHTRVQNQQRPITDGWDEAWSSSGDEERE